MVTRESYATLPAFAADTPAPLVLTRTRTLERMDNLEHEWAQANYSYHQDRTDPLQYGRIRSQGTTLNRHTRFIEYSYHKAPGRTGQTVLFTTERASSDFDTQTKQVTQQTSLLHGLALLEENDEGQMVESVYDRLLRMVRQTTAVGTPHEASITFRYRLSTDDSQQAYQENTNVKGRVTRLLFDGLNRTVAETCIDQANAAFLNQPRPTYSASYDALGQLVSETHYDWLGDQQYPLTTLTRYDDWGQPCQITDPDGLEHFSVQSPTQRTLLAWDYSAAQQRKSAQTLTYLNRFDKPDRQLVFAADADPVTAFPPLAQHLWHYNGLGQCTEETEIVQGDAAPHVETTTTYTYDFWGRLATSTLPDYSRVVHTYAEHSGEALNVAIAVYPYGRDASAGPITLGRRTFDSLDRLTSNTCAQRTETLHYQDSQMRPQWLETADQQRFDYLYLPQLTEAPIEVKVNQHVKRFTYDDANAQLLQSTDAQGHYAFTYDQHGALAQEVYTASDAQQWTHDQVNSRLGRVLSRNTHGGLQTVYDYDRHGRLVGARQGALQATYSYDGFGRLRQSVCLNQASQETLTTDLEYDDLGREVLRRAHTPGHPTTECRQAWRSDNLLVRRHLLAGDTTLLLETFDYDERNRLQIYTATGTDLPKDRYGNALKWQFFTYDSFDNVTTRLTDYSHGGRDIAGYEYNADDPCQLLAITHSLAPYPARTELRYDAAGRQQVDLDGRQLAYDERSRLVAVRSPDGQETLVRYRYDCHDRLIGVTHGDQPEVLRFYVGTRVEHTEQAGRQTWYLYNGDSAIGQQYVQAGQPGQALLLLSNANLSVIGELDSDGLRRTTFGAYGETADDPARQCSLGFNGEQRELATGWYLLGNGYRAYDPELMRFHCPDSMSPFDGGGLNAYMYCLGNPIGYRDPTGHLSTESWAGIGLSALFSYKAVLALKVAVGIILAPATGGLSFAIAVGSAVATTTFLLGTAMATAGGIWLSETDEPRATEQAKALLYAGIALTLLSSYAMAGASSRQRALAKGSAPGSASRGSNQALPRPSLTDSDYLSEAEQFMGFRRRTVVRFAPGTRGGVFQATQGGVFQAPQGGVFQAPQRGVFQAPQGGVFRAYQPGVFQAPQGRVLQAPQGVVPGSPAGSVSSSSVSKVSNASVRRISSSSTGSESGKTVIETNVSPFYKFGPRPANTTVQGIISKGPELKDFRFDRY